MTLDTTLSLDIVIAIIVVFGAVWRLDGKITELRKELSGEIADWRKELKDDVTALRQENQETRREFKNDITRVEAKVDDSIQRLARLEGRFEGRDDRLEPEREADPTT